MDSPARPPKISVLKTSLERSLDIEDTFESTTLSNSLSGSQNPSMNASLYESTTSSLIDPPVPPTATYIAPNSSPPIPRASGSTAWDYENYIEKPRGTARNTLMELIFEKGKVAEPHYVSPQTSQDFSARGFLNEQEEGGYGGTGHSSLGIAPALLAICAYFFGFFGGLIVMILERKNLFVVFHGWQSMTMGVFAFVIQIVFVWSKSIYTFLWIIYLLFTFYMVLRVIQDAPTQRLLKLPIIGDWCEYRAYNKLQYHTGSSNVYRMA